MMMSMRIDGASMDAKNNGCVAHGRPARSMSNWSAALLLAVAASLPAHLALGADTTMVLLQPDKLQWGDPILPGSPIPAFEKGAKVAVLQGVPGQGGPVVVRLRFPANYAIAAHWHSTDEIIIVLEGTLHAGMGDALDREKSLAFPTGAFVVMPAKHHHFAWTQEETIVEIHANNPFDIVYVNPADDPRRR
jgi:mannose-6-phosphate isomerase-like protein (cupin superfamily)